LVRSGRW